MDNRAFVCRGDEMETNIRDAAGKKRISLPRAPGYFRVHGFIPESGLLKAFRGTTKRMSYLFGPKKSSPEMLKMYPDGKYTSDYCIERVEGSGEFYTLYRCYSEWRVGGLDSFCPHLGELLELIEPVAHQGWSRVLPNRIYCNSLYAGVLATDEMVSLNRSRLQRSIDHQLSPPKPAIPEPQDIPTKPVAGKREATPLPFWIDDECPF